MMFCIIWGYFTFQVPGFMLEYYECRFGMDLHNRLLTLLFPNGYVKFRLVCDWLQEILGGFGWFRVVSDGFRWFRVVSCFTSYLVGIPLLQNFRSIDYNL